MGHRLEKIEPSVPSKDLPIWWTTPMDDRHKISYCLSPPGDCPLLHLNKQEVRSLDLLGWVELDKIGETEMETEMEIG